MPNHLINENSPYLIQHAENPVDWYPWGDEALEIARRDNKPIFLSIGYAACHWCHVMAHESFEDPETASFMNKHFVNIKVDREERPDLDSIYMSAVVAISGQGGWPMSVFLTPEGQPFYGGTYYPPVPRYNMPSFREVLARVYQVWSQDQQQVIGSAKKVSEYIQQTNQIPIPGQGIRAESLEKAAFSLGQSYDWKFGGWGSAPKFPQPMAIEFLLRRAVRGDRFALDIAAHALQAMSKGGMYDVIGGGFARYSTDNYWLVPHFEKMLYDNALLASAYLHAYLVTGDAAYRQVCESTLDFINREMTHPAGGFYSSLDADSEGREGSFYLWTLQDVRSALQDESDIKLFTAAYTISEAGNFDGANILQRAKTDLQLADQFAISEVEVRERLSELHSRLLRIRQRRVRPATDDKVLVAWNALALIAFSEAARYLQRDDYLDVARKNADFLLKQLWVDGHLMRSWREGQARHNAYLEDYAGLILGLLALYQSDPETSWFASANELTNEMVQHFRDPNIGFFDTRDDHEMLITRPKDIQDNATPSGNAQAATALILMAAYTGNGEWRDIAESMLASVEHQAARYPTAFSQWLCAIDAALSDFKQIAIVGDTTDSATQSLRHIVWQVFRPNLVLAASKLPVPDQAPPLLHQRTMINHLPTAYVCQDFVCQLPVTDPRQLEKQLAPS